MDKVQMIVGWTFAGAGALVMLAALVAATVAAWAAAVAATKTKELAKKATKAAETAAAPTATVAEQTAAADAAAGAQAAVVAAKEGAGLLKDLMANPIGLSFVMAVLAQVLGWSMLRGGEALQIVTFTKPSW